MKNKHVPPQLLLCCAFATVVLLASLTRSHAAATVYHDLASWTAAAGLPVVVEDFADSTLAPGLTITLGKNQPPGSIAGGVYTDTAVTQVNDADNPKINFGGGAFVFSADWDLTEGGRGLGVVLVLKFADGTSDFLFINNPISGGVFTGFLGFVSDVAVTSIRLDSSQVESFTVDNLRYRIGVASLYTLNVNIAGSGNVLVSPLGPYVFGSFPVVTASPSAGWIFKDWTGSFTSTLNPILPLMDGNKTLTATFIPTPQSGPNFIVTTTDDHDDGTPGVVDCTLREAINAANANPDASTITFAANVTGVIPLTLGELTVNQNLKVLGPGAAVLAISGNHNSRVFKVSAGTMLISSLTISDGRAVGVAGSAGQSGGGAGGPGGEAWGGGIHNQSVLTVSNCWIVGNTAQGGWGGIGGPDDALNPAGPGGIGGLGAGGGIYNHGELTLINCTLSGNSAAGGNGGNGADALNLSLNAGGGGVGGEAAGGGIGNSVFLHMTNCTISGNFSNGGPGGKGGGGFVAGAGGAGGRSLGGGVYTIPEIHIASCTVSFNSLSGGAGGIGGNSRMGVAPSGLPGREEGGGLVMVGGPIFIQNSLIAGNTGLFAPDCSGNFISAGHNLVGMINGASGFAHIGDQTGTTALPLNPMLGSLLYLGGTTPTIGLLPGSPALDQGNRGLVNYDQRGQPRPSDFPSIPNASGGDGSDIGAFELSRARLKIKKVLNNVVLSWSTNDVGYTLQSTGQPEAPTTWSTVDVSPVKVDGEFTVTRPAIGRQFYRLNWAGVASIPGLFNTGLGTNAALLGAGAVDPHWLMFISADPAFPSMDAVVVNDTGFPIPPWLANGPASKWLAPQASQSIGNLFGDYKYRISFDLTGLEASTAVIVGRWTSDNLGPQVLLNGVATGITSDGNFTVLGNVFTISTGFVAGANTLDFVVNNAGPSVNPTGVRVELNGMANRKVVTPTQPIPGLFSTGVGPSGAVLASGTVDPHWQLVRSADPAFPGPNAIVVNDTGFPIPPWLPNGPDSKWIAPQASQTVGNLFGDYTYRITFDLTGRDRSTAVIAGRWTSDNLGSHVLLNGVTTGNTSDGNFGALGNEFTIKTDFLPGLNTLDFVVNNAGLTVNPTGVRVELSGTALLRP